MSGNQIVLIEMILVFGLVLAWAVWEVVSVRRSLQRDRDASAERARQSGPQERPDQR